MAESEVNYKDTLSLPKTDFPMKANLPQREPEFIQFWNEQEIYKKIIENRKGSKTFAMPDGPPYANGKLHMGTTLNKILKDIIIKYKNMSGKQAVFIPGWDCHGLPIEQAVAKQLGPKIKELSDNEIRGLCRKEAHKWIDIQREQFIRQGILADWKSPYLTLQKEYEAEEVRVLAQLFKKGVIYRGKKPVYWSWAFQTALAEAEVEYKDHKSPSIYVKFEIENSDGKFKTDKKTSFVIWTTTPWTLPANLALSVHPDFDYGVFDTGSEYLIIAKDLKESFEKETEITLKEVDTFKGSAVEGLKARHPMYERDSILVLGTHVTLEAGTGVVHTAPGHGQEDYEVGLRYNLDVYSPVNERGEYTTDVPEYEGINVFKANPLIVERLKESGHLIKVSTLEHSYPHCWRSKTPLIFRATPQWFMGMDLEGNPIRKLSLEEINKTKWIPAWGIKRISGMIENRPDWCLSRQRMWGVPIPVFYCTKCDHALAKPEVMNRVADVMESENGIDSYFESEPLRFIEGEKCEKCGHTEFKKGKDILDVWFDSGVCFAAVQKRREGLTYPADIYIEGSDQHRGWFHTSLLASVAAEGKAPYKTVITHGFVMYAKGQKMSKSLGNVIDPNDIIKTNGAEILRLWASHEDYTQDLSCSPESFKRLSETYRRLRNTYRFLLGNISDFDCEKDFVRYENLQELDKWILSRFNRLIKNVRSSFEAYEFYKVYHSVNQFATVDLSSLYLDILKDRLYTWKADGTERRSAQTTLLLLIENLVVLMAPILSFLSEETYRYLPKKTKESVFLEDFPEFKSDWDQPELESKYDKLLEVREIIYKDLEELRAKKIIGSSLAAKVTVTGPKDLCDQLVNMEKWLADFLIVSQTEVKEGENLKILAEPADGEKCERCWKIKLDIGIDSRHPKICGMCSEALS